jgi:FMN phosphatase YigB (HAD superfamily)
MSRTERDPYVQTQHEKLHRLGITALIFDLDDTLVDTHPLFIDNMWNFSGAVARDLGLDINHVYDRLSAINIEEHKRNGADPHNWIIDVQRLGAELGNTDLLFSHFHHLQKIYTDAPDIICGVRPFLSGLSADHFLLGEVTWGEMDWSLRKNDQTSITHFFDSITYADIHKPKTSADWLRCMKALTVTPQQCLIIGDSIPGDIIPAIELGARAIYKTSPWSVFREGQLPLDVLQMQQFADIYETISKLQ